jgi:carbon starvation protein CstA
LAGPAVGEYNLYLYDHGRQTLFFYFAAANQFCVIVQLVAVACGVVAIRRQSNWWLLTGVPAAVLALGCYFGDL